LTKTKPEFVNYLSESVEMVACYFKELLRFHLTMNEKRTRMNVPASTDDMNFSFFLHRHAAALNYFPRR